MTKPNDAINDQAQPDTDVSAEDNTAADQNDQTGKPPLSEREQRMQEIARDYRTGNGYEEVAERDDDEEQEEVAHDPATQEAAEDDEESDDAAQDPLKELGYYRKGDGQLYTKMKVNGVEREVPASQVQAYLQKDMAGDQKLQQAADQMRQMQQKEREIRDMEARIRQQSNQPPGKGAEEIRQQAKQVLSKLWDGDDEAAAEALSDFIQQNSGRVDTNEILQQAEQRAMSAYEQREAEQRQRQWQSSTQEGINWLKENHAEILEDDDKRDYVDHLTAKMVEAQENGDPTLASLAPRDIIQRAAEKANQLWKGEASPAPKGNAREDRKKNLKPVPRGMAKQPTQKNPRPEVDNSPAAVVERMRQARAVN
tara:strand:+ start:4843 stop:5946 length:1104 start_codon:yes stop_codon:yes gene_type:complete